MTALWGAALSSTDPAVGSRSPKTDLRELLCQIRPAMQMEFKNPSKPYFYQVSKLLIRLDKVWMAFFVIPFLSSRAKTRDPELSNTFC